MAEQIPMKLDGGLWLTAPDEGHANLVWADPFEFDAELKLVGYQKTARRGDFYLWADTETNATFPMSPRELYEALLKSMPEDGVLDGLWGFTKNNGRFSLRLIEELED